MDDSFVWRKLNEYNRKQFSFKIVGEAVIYIIFAIFITALCIAYVVVEGDISWFVICGAVFVLLSLWIFGDVLYKIVREKRILNSADDQKIIDNYFRTDEPNKRELYEYVSNIKKDDILLTVYDRYETASIVFIDGYVVMCASYVRVVRNEDVEIITATYSEKQRKVFSTINVVMKNKNATSNDIKDIKKIKEDAFRIIFEKFRIDDVKKQFAQIEELGIKTDIIDISKVD